MTELQGLLSDIPASERQEALSYYESYFDETGEGMEEEVIRTLGSPQSVAAQIKANLKESNESYGEYSESGYEDSRSPRHEQVPQPYGRSRTNSVIILAIIALVFLAPFIKGIFGGVAGVLVTILLLPFLLAFALGVASIGMLIGGIACVAVGVTLCFSNPPAGFLTMGVGFILAALGIGAFLLLFYIASKWLPRLLRGVTSLAGRIFHRKGGASA
jgi:hypothetical protein